MLFLHLCWYWFRDLKSIELNNIFMFVSGKNGVEKSTFCETELQSGCHRFSKWCSDAGSLFSDMLLKSLLQRFIDYECTVCCSLSMNKLTVIQWPLNLCGSSEPIAVVGHVSVAPGHSLLSALAFLIIHGILWSSFLSISFVWCSWPKMVGTAIILYINLSHETIKHLKLLETHVTVVPVPLALFSLSSQIVPCWFSFSWDVLAHWRSLRWDLLQSRAKSACSAQSRPKQWANITCPEPQLHVVLKR